MVAAVNGPAVGIGCSLALACDLIMAAESAFFGLAFVNIGLMPDGGSTAFVPPAVGRARAFQMAMLGERIPAPQALEWGLVNWVHPDDRLMAEADALVERMAAGPDSLVRRLQARAQPVHLRRPRRPARPRGRAPARARAHPRTSSRARRRSSRSARRRSPAVADGQLGDDLLAGDRRGHARARGGDVRRGPLVEPLGADRRARAPGAAPAAAGRVAARRRPRAEDHVRRRALGPRRRRPRHRPRTSTG